MTVPDSESCYSAAGESSQWGLTRRVNRPRLLCVVCQEDGQFYQVTPVSCGHAYCRQCLEGLFIRSFTDDSLFPPRCRSRPILPENVRLYITEAIVARYQERKLEFDTPNPIYCALPTCSKFIHPDNILEHRAICPKCTTDTCTKCKAEYRDEEECKVDRGLQLVLATARVEGWKQCSSCQTMVEHNLGCNHMT